jgi:hypothetical protein
MEQEPPMNRTDRAVPHAGGILREQMRTVSHFPGRYILLGAAALALTVVVGLIVVRRSPALASHPPIFWTESVSQLVLLSFAFPVAVWWSLPLRRRGYEFAMPTRPSVVTLSRTAAGLIWLLAIVVGLLVGAGVVAKVLDGQVGVYSRIGSEYQVVPRWYWITPLVSASIAYAFGSALVIGTKHPIVSGVAGAYALMILGEVAENVGGSLGWLDRLAHGPFGLVPVLTGLTKRLEATPASGGVPVFAGMYPVFWTWLTSATTWAALAAIALFLAVRRHHDV